MRSDLLKQTDLTEHSISMLHNFYILAHEAHKADSKTWTVQHCNRVLTNVMGGHQFSWRVVGITPKALRQFEQQKFKYLTGCGITRAHIIARRNTVETMICRDIPLSASEFISLWIDNDRTVLCIRGENNNNLLDWLEFPPMQSPLFSSTTAGWRHGKDEIDFLKSFSAKTR
jgi:hypothetical protein